MVRIFLLCFVLAVVSGCASEEVIKIGWVSDITGPAAKYGALEAGLLAVNEINEAGGIDSRPIMLIVEDGKCNSIEATKAAQKLIQIDKVKFILGGHCSPESLGVAPVVKENEVLMLASITTSPLFSDPNPYVLRTSPISTIQSELMANHAAQSGFTKLAVLYEQTDYAMPIGKTMADHFLGEVVILESYIPGTLDFKAELTKIKDSSADALLLAVQSPDAAITIMKQIHELGLNMQLYGNDVFVIQVAVDEVPELYEGVVYALPVFDMQSEKSNDFVNIYEKNYGRNPPYGIWTAESYDAVYMLAEAIEHVGEDPIKISEYLRRNSYHGASGIIDIDELGNGQREYALGVIRDGKKTRLE